MGTKGKEEKNHRYRTNALLEGGSPSVRLLVEEKPAHVPASSSFFLSGTSFIDSAKNGFRTGVATKKTAAASA